MYPQLVIAQYGQYLAAMYIASLFNPSKYFPGILLMYVPPVGAPRQGSVQESESEDLR